MMSQNDETMSVNRTMNGTTNSTKYYNKVINQKDRITYIDFLRGIIILDMVLVHFSNILPTYIEKAINLFDFAIEGFILISGIMIGMYYYRLYLTDQKKVIKKIIYRTLQIAIIYYIMNLTIVIPYFTIIEKVNIQDLSIIIKKSILFQNQIGIIHILPTFIPLFIVSIPILFLMKKKLETLIILISCTLFIIGCERPQIFNIGDPTIFPVILWQIYFCLGCVIGKKISSENIQSYNKKSIIFVIISILIFTTTIKYGGMFFPNIKMLQFKHEILGIKKFYLNFGGFVHGLSLLLLVHFISCNYFNANNKNIICRHLSVLGKNSLLVFVVHSYLFYSIKGINYILDNYIVNLTLIFLSIIFMFYISFKHEKNRISFNY